MPKEILLHHHGPALWPEIFPPALLQARRRELGSSLFEAVYQGAPAPAAGQVFRWEWLGVYDAVPRLVEIGQAWDTAVKAGQEHDYTCGITGGRDADGLIYLLDLWRGQAEPPAVQRQIVTMATRWRPRWILVEDAAAGATLLRLMRAQCAAPLLPVKPDRDKRRRALSVTPLVESGVVRLPATAPWVEEFRNELLAFPAGAHDDQVDAFVYLLARLAARQGVPIEQWSAIKRPANW